MSSPLRRSVHVPGLTHPGQPIAAAVIGGGWVFSCPIGPRRLGTGVIPPELDEQIPLTFANLQRVLEASGIGPEHVMFVRVLLSTMADRARFNDAWVEFFGLDGPARQITESPLPEGARLLLRFTALEAPSLPEGEA